MAQLKDVLVIGAGSIGERHVRCFRHTGRANVLLCEIDSDLAGQVGERYGLHGVFSDLDEAMAAAPEAAVICTPAHLHVPMALKLADAGVHLLIEKPLSTNLDGIDALERIVREKELTAAVAYVYRAHPVLTAMRNELHTGRFGKPVELSYVGGQHFPFYRPAYREIYYKDRSTGGGAIQDALTHVVNAAEWMIGPVTRVAADAAHLLLPGVEVEDTVHALARHAGVLASYALNQHQAPNESTFTVACERGTVRCELHACRWMWQTRPEENWHVEQFEPVERDGPFVSQANAFLDTLCIGARPLCTLEEAVQTLRANLALLESVETRAWQEIDPDKRARI